MITLSKEGGFALLTVQSVAVLSIVLERPLKYEPLIRIKGSNVYPKIVGDIVTGEW
jgi:hypothetical protein